MSDVQARAARRRFQRESTTLCGTCGGSGLVVSEDAKAKARVGGKKSYLRSLMKSELSMSERGQLGGRPKDVRLSDLDAVERSASHS